MYEKRSNNLCSIYMLPLIGLKPADFGSDNFVSCYVDETNTYLVVELKQITQTNNQFFRFQFKEDDKNFAVFEVPNVLRDTLSKFREGKYSQFSKDAKTVIQMRSGLAYKVKKPNGRYTSARDLLVLDKDEELRKVMEMELNVKIAPDAELASIPGEDNFYQLNLKKSLTSGLTTTN